MLESIIIEFLHLLHNLPNKLKFIYLHFLDLRFTLPLFTIFLFGIFLYDSNIIKDLLRLEAYIPFLDFPFLRIEFIGILFFILIFLNRKLWLSFKLYPQFKKFYLKSDNIDNEESFKEIWKNYVDICKKIDFEIDSYDYNNNSKLTKTKIITVKLNHLFFSNKTYQDSILIIYVILSRIVNKRFKKMRIFSAKKPEDWSQLSVKSIYYSYLKIFFEYGLSYDIQNHNDKSFLDKTINSMEINGNLKTILLRTHFSGYGNNSTISLMNVISIYLRLSEENEEIIDKKIDFSIEYDFGWLHRRIFEVIIALSICYDEHQRNAYYKELKTELKKLENNLRQIDKKIKRQFIKEREDVLTNFRDDFIKPIFVELGLEYA